MQVKEKEKESEAPEEEEDCSFFCDICESYFSPEKEQIVDVHFQSSIPKPLVPSKRTHLFDRKIQGEERKEKTRLFFFVLSFSQPITNDLFRLNYLPFFFCKA